MVCSQWRRVGIPSHVKVLYWKGRTDADHYLYEVDPAALRHGRAYGAEEKVPWHGTSLTRLTQMPASLSWPSVTAPGHERSASSSSKARACKTSNARSEDSMDADGNEVYDSSKPNSLRTGKRKRVRP